MQLRPFRVSHPFVGSHSCVSVFKFRRRFAPLVKVFTAVPRHAGAGPVTVTPTRGPAASSESESVVPRSRPVLGLGGLRLARRQAHTPPAGRVRRRIRVAPRTRHLGPGQVGAAVAARWQGRARGGRGSGRVRAARGRAGGRQCSPARGPSTPPRPPGSDPTALAAGGDDGRFAGGPSDSEQGLGGGRAGRTAEAAG
jgi:hypothetical protein